MVACCEPDDRIPDWVKPRFKPNKEAWEIPPGQYEFSGIPSSDPAPDFIKAVADYAASMSPWMRPCYEPMNETYHSEEAFDLMFGWMKPADQKQFRELVFKRRDDAEGEQP